MEQLINPLNILLLLITVLLLLVIFLPNGKQSELAGRLGDSIVKMLAGLGAVKVLQLAGILGIMQ